MIIIFKILIGLFIIRFYGERYGLRFNPLMRKLNELSDPIVKPVRELWKKSKWRPRFDPSSLTVGAILAILAGIILTRSILTGIWVGIILLFLQTWLQLLTGAIFVIVIASWLQSPPNQPIVEIARSCIGWLMNPLRRIIPPLGMLDFTPMVALFILLFLNGSVIPALLNIRLL